MLNRGWRTPDGQQVQGLRDLLDQLRLEREEQLDRGDLGGGLPGGGRRGCSRYWPRSAIRHRPARGRRPRVPGTSAVRRSPTRWPTSARDAARPAPERPGRQRCGACRAMSSSPPRGPPALRGADGSGCARRWPRPTSTRCPRHRPTPIPNSLAHMREGFDALNRMIEQREAGEDHRSDVRVVHGAVRRPVPGQPRPTLDELLEQLAAADGRGAGHVELWDVARAAQPAPGSGRVAPGGPRSALAGRFRLAGNLQRAFPGAGLGPAVPIQRRRARWAWGRGPRRRRAAAGPRRAWRTSLALGHLAGRPVGRGGLPTRCGSLLGDDAANSLDRLSNLAKQLADAGLIDQREGRDSELTPKAIRRIGQQALVRSVRPVRPRTAWVTTGPRGRAPGTIARRPPRPTSSAIPSTSTCPGRCTTRFGGRAAACPVRLSPDDFDKVIETTEALTRSATVLLLDLSLSMPMRDNFVPAKKMALALHTLITTRGSPRDYLGPGRLLRGGPGPVIEPGGPAHGELGLCATGPTCSTGLILARKMLAFLPPTGAPPSRSSWSPTVSPPPHIIPDFYGRRGLRRVLQLSDRSASRWR